MATKGALVHPRLTEKIAKTFLGRDPGIKLYRVSDTTDAEGDYVGTETLIATFDGSLGIPNDMELEIASQRGAPFDVEMDTVIPDGFDFIVGDFVEARGVKWTVVDRFYQIVAKVHLKQIGVL